MEWFILSSKEKQEIYKLSDVEAIEADVEVSEDKIVSWLKCIRFKHNEESQATS